MQPWSAFTNCNYTDSIVSPGRVIKQHLLTDQQDKAALVSLELDLQNPRGIHPFQQLLKVITHVITHVIASPNPPSMENENAAR